MEYYIFLRKLKLKSCRITSGKNWKTGKRKRHRKKQKKLQQQRQPEGTTWNLELKKRPPDFHRRPSS